VLEIAEKLYRFQQRFWRIIGVHHGQHCTLKRLVCQVLYFYYSQVLTMPTKQDEKRLLASLRIVLRNIGTSLEFLNSFLRRRVQEEENSERKKNAAANENHQILEAVQALRDCTQAFSRQHHTDQQEGYRFQRWSAGIQAIICLATIGAFGAAAYYACVARRQLRQVTRANDMTEQAMQIQVRPWIGIDIEQVATAPTFAWPSPGSSIPAMELDFRLAIKNFGASPALHENSGVLAIPINVPKGISTQEPPTKLMNSFCNMPTSNVGNTLLPSAVFRGIQPALFGAWDGKQTHFSLFWIVACVVYEDAKRHIHHSKYLYLTTHQPNSVPTQFSGEHPQWTYVPISGVTIWDSEAD
jgi:hypothetical protein